LFMANVADITDLSFGGKPATYAADILQAADPKITARTVRKARQGDQAAAGRVRAAVAGLSDVQRGRLLAGTPQLPLVRPSMHDGARSDRDRAACYRNRGRSWYARLV
jgi:large exoprotein involved in heme utilization and adhesion